MKTWKNLSVGERAAWIGVFGLLTVALIAFMLPKMFPEKSTPVSPTYFSSANSGDTLQGNGNVLDKSTKNFYGDTNKPTFKLYINNEETGATNGSTIRLPSSREIKLFIMNRGEETATHTRIEFFVDSEQSSNFITANGWELQPPVVFQWNKTNYDSFSAHWLLKWDEPIPGGKLYNQLPSIFVQTNVWVPTNYELPALATHIIIFADNSKLQEFIVWFLFAEQPLGILPSEPGYHPL